MRLFAGDAGLLGRREQRVRTPAAGTVLRCRVDGNKLELDPRRRPYVTVGRWSKAQLRPVKRERQGRIPRVDRGLAGEVQT